MEASGEFSYSAQLASQQNFARTKLGGRVYYQKSDIYE
jgi:hypothetical protein